MMKTTFESIAGHPALDLVNTQDWRFRATGTEERLRTYDDLLRFTEQSELPTPKQTRELRAKASARTLERYVQAARLKQTLSWRQSPRLEWEWPGEQDPELPLWALALSASERLTSDAVDKA